MKKCMKILRCVTKSLLFSFTVMDNYTNVPRYLYGLSPSQMDMFMTEDNPVRRQAENVTEVGKTS